MKHLAILVILILTCIGCQENQPTSNVPSNTNQADSIWSIFQNLEGTWEGGYRWEGSKEGEGKLKITYKPIGKMAISENHLNENDQITMSSIYHLDGNKLRVTHFCWFTQPRLILSNYDLSENKFRFEKIDVTNTQRHQGHVVGIEVDKKNSDSLHINLEFKDDDGLSTEKVRLKRTGYGNRGSKLFSDGVISNGHAYGISFNRAMNEAFFTYQEKNSEKGFIYTSTKANGVWSKPEVANFSGQFEEFDPNISPDHKYMFIMTSRPLSGTKPSDNFDIWYLTNNGGEWVDPKPLGPNVNTQKTEGVVGITESGTMYFFSTKDGGHGASDIYEATFDNGTVTNVKNIGKPINSEHWDGHPAISPDGKFLIFYSDTPQNTYGNGDLFVSVNKNGKWTKPKNLGPKVNTEECEITPSFSPDMKTLFFGRIHTKVNTDLNVADRSIWSIELDELDLDNE